MMLEETPAPLAMPESLAALLSGYRWCRDTTGESGGSVYRLQRADRPDLFLKYGGGDVAADILDETVRLRWLATHMPVPRIMYSASTPDESWLVMTALTGQTAYQCLTDDPHKSIAIVDALAAFMRRLHAVPTSACPFDSDHAYRLAKARDRLDAGLVDEDDFDDERAGWTAQAVWDAMNGLLPFAPDPVVTHGDFSLDNLLMADGAVVGCIDVGRVGIADRYQDIAILWNCLGEFDAPLQRRFLDQYGAHDLDRAKLQFHLMLDEFF
ncbi:APH(3')-I family aminoglycoside O-phosphotransferase [Sphingomonas bisphenolicum]|uniref:Aminoglycoside 3'-phosphotransferase n=1 Tax=Sphingomonas bisphenolicum TaxID=296544 RepID=A0ABN5WFZ0_9SPHN|nr:APH(3')-I family aminoglycoside O-phosphotransferase [Sphingomonas bisphenolicum]BBF68162.1 aminoglycoside phosphotransferase APH(3') [Sphingomonas bisphenolicum]